MEQKVTVAAVLPDGTARVFVKRIAACTGDCHTCGGCETPTVFVMAKNPVGAVPGDTAILSAQSSQIFAAMAVVYLLPLALLLLGYFVGLWLTLPGLWAAIGFALGIGCILLYHRRMQKRPVDYCLTRILEE